MAKHAAAGAGREAPKGNGPREISSEDLDLVFVTKAVSDEEQAAVIAALGELRTEETLQVKKVARRANEPWRRSQRSPEGIREFTE